MTPNMMPLLALTTLAGAPYGSRRAGKPRRSSKMKRAKLKAKKAAKMARRRNRGAR